MKEPNISSGEGVDQESLIKKSDVLPLIIRSKAELYTMYMPFLKNGGLFIQTAKPYDLGAEIFLLVELMQEPAKLPVACRVVWITPLGTQGRVSGIGVEFHAKEGLTIRNKIETYLAGSLQSDNPTNTL